MQEQWNNLKGLVKKIFNMQQIDEQKLMSLMENFTGQSFQWVKTKNPELLGKVVRCRDVKPLNNGRFVVIFDDTSQIDSSQISSDMMMISGDTKPLTKQEVESIAGPIRPTTQPPAQRASPESLLHGPGPQAKPQLVNTPVQPKSNIFSMFNSEESEIDFTLKVKLPNKKLLKLMYSNAENKKEFLSELSNYIHSVINKQVVSESAENLLGIVKEKPVVATIKITEINESATK